MIDAGIDRDTTGTIAMISSVVFHSDGMQLLRGTQNGLQQWRVADGQGIGKRRGMKIRIISVSNDGKWIVCGTTRGASVWDANIQEKSVEVEGTVTVGAVDISPTCTRFDTGASGHGARDGYRASIWNITTGERLVGPLQHDSWISGIKFSPNGAHIATAVRDDSIRVFDSRTGDQLITIKANISEWTMSTPLAWSPSGKRLFSVSSDGKINAFDVSTGSQLAESQVHGSDDEARSIALAANGKFLATFAGPSITFWDTSTLTRIGPIIKGSQWVWSIALSPDCRHLATGGVDGNITIRNLNNILPDLYGPFHVSIHAFTILLDKPHIVFPLFISPLGTYSGKSRIGRIYRWFRPTRRVSAFGLGSAR